jgi:dephospho-CoA kinase
LPRAVAITGGICDGKSTVLQELASRGFPTFVADEVAREVLSDPGLLERLVELFGSDAVSGDRLNAAFLRSHVLPDPDRRRKLNALAHSHTLSRLLERVAATDGLAFVEVPLLIETCSQRYFDEVWVTVSSPEEQLRRLTERLGGDSDAAARLLGTQLPTRAKIPFADKILRTLPPVLSVKSEVDSALAPLLRG